ncbi:MAG: hypothetical protein HZC36_15945 [Armatimonadetes bacterium]|nr:hypothetical protein [Armatimonadota bacterium]
MRNTGQRLWGRARPAVVGGVIGFLLFVLGVLWYRRYDATLFLGIPFVAGAIAIGLAEGAPLSLSRSVMYGLAPLPVMGVLAQATGFEGAACILIGGAIIAIPAIAVGVLLYLITESGKKRRRRGPMALIPTGLLLGVWQFGAPEPSPQEIAVTTRVHISASANSVWQVISGDLTVPLPADLGAAIQLASPVETKMHGRGKGAIRKCTLTSGTCVQRVTDWRPGQGMAFEVLQSPPVMKETNIWGDIRPPHLEHSVESTRGEFRIVPDAMGGVWLERTTWYTLDMGPRAYWQAIWTWSVDRSHRLVLERVQQLAEAQSQPPTNCASRSSDSIARNPSSS